MIIKIPLMCRPKKNSQQILKNKKTGKYFIGQSELYTNFEIQKEYKCTNKLKMYLLRQR